jgi:hypothetical protein
MTETAIFTELPPKLQEINNKNHFLIVKPCKTVG